MKTPNPFWFVRPMEIILTVWLALVLLTIIVVGLHSCQTKDRTPKLVQVAAKRTYVFTFDYDSSGTLVRYQQTQRYVGFAKMTDRRHLVVWWFQPDSVTWQQMVVGTKSFVITPSDTCLLVSFPEGDAVRLNAVPSPTQMYHIPNF